MFCIIFVYCHELYAEGSEASFVIFLVQGKAFWNLQKLKVFSFLAYQSEGFDKLLAWTFVRCRPSSTIYKKSFLSPHFSMECFHIERK